MDPNAKGRRAVVVTGSSTGIGRATALLLHSHGFQVFAGVRKESDGERLVSEAPERLTPLLIDITDVGSIEAAARLVAGAEGERGLAGLVNNAGIVVVGPLEILPIEELRRQLEVNVIGQVAVTQAFLPMLRKARGRVVNVGSTSGRVTLPMLGAYAASKSALGAVTDAMRQELHRWGIWVAIVEPGATATPIWQKSSAAAESVLEDLPAERRNLYADMFEVARTASRGTMRFAIPPEKVAECVAHALTAPRPRAHYLIGRGSKLRVALSRLLPARAFDALVRRAMKV